MLAFGQEGACRGEWGVKAFGKGGACIRPGRCRPDARALPVGGQEGASCPAAVGGVAAHSGHVPTRFEEILTKEILEIPKTKTNEV